MNGKASGAGAIEGDNGQPLNAARHVPPSQRILMEYFNRLLGFTATRASDTGREAVL
jgi:hypothetical protein